MNSRKSKRLLLMNLNEEPLLMDIIVDKDKDTITYVFYNDRIEVPNTGV